MIVPKLLSTVASNISNFHNLALFICHLFIDGGFRHGHILYDPKVFDNHLITKIDSICLVKIPWLTTDFTQPSTLAWHHSERTDHILQLIFFDPNHLAEDIDKFKDYFTFYRIFVFDSTATKIKTQQQPRKSIIRERNPVFNSSSLILEYNTDNDLVSVTGETTLNSTKYSIRNKSIKYEHIFDETFGKFEQLRPIAVRALGVFRDKGGQSTYDPLHGQLYYANFFALNLNETYLNMTFAPVGSFNGSWPYKTVIQNKRKYYKELLLEFKPVDDVNSTEKMKNVLPSALHIDSILMPTGNNQGTMAYPLYPFDPIELAVVFVYGANFQRQLNILTFPKAVQILSGLIVLFMSLAALILSIVRRKWHLRRSNVLSVIEDIIISFIAGGNLQMRHKCERWFFGIMLVAAFFITSIFAGDLFDCIYRILFQEIDTFDKLIATKSPIYINQSLKMYRKDIWTMVRRKMGANSNYYGPEFMSKLTEHETNCFTYVLETSRREYFVRTLLKSGRDFDVLPEILGSTHAQFHLESDHYVTDRTIKKLDQTTSFMVENGLHKFYLSLAIFKQKLIDRAYLEQIDDDFQALTVEQLKRPMILLFYLWGMATIIFIAETTIFKWIYCNRRRNSNPHN